MENLCKKCKKLVKDINTNTGIAYTSCVKCRKYFNTKMNEYTSKNRQLINEKARMRRKMYKDVISKQRRYKRQQLRQKVLDMYGIICSHCGDSRKKMLTIDHINNDGSKHRKIIGRRSEDICLDVLKEYRPDKYQTLCIACNWHKGIFGKLPELDFYYEDIREG